MMWEYAAAGEAISSFINKQLGMVMQNWQLSVSRGHFVTLWDSVMHMTTMGKYLYIQS